MLPQNKPDRIRILFATIAWWPMPVLPAWACGVDHQPGPAPGRASVEQAAKEMTRPMRPQKDGVGCVVKAPSTRSGGVNYRVASL